MKKEKVLDIICISRNEADRIGSQFTNEMRVRFDAFSIYLERAKQLSQTGDLSPEQMFNILKRIENKVMGMSYLPHSVSNREQKRVWDELIGKIQVEE